MTGYIGLLMLIGIAGFIVFLFVRRKGIENEITDFYQSHSLYQTKDAPQNIRESLGESENLYCCRTNLVTLNGANIEFCWWEWYVKSTTMVNNVPSTSYAYYLAVSFSPNTVSEDFVQKAIKFADKSELDVTEKIKDFFVTNTENPYRAEKLADGSFLICWRVLKRREIYEAKFNWLKNNISPFITPEMDLLENIHSLLPKNLETIPEVFDQSETVKSEIAGTVFYTHDSYPMLRHKFTSGWTNLDLELHHESGKLDKEGYDEFDSDTTFGDLNIPNKTAFTLTDETTVRTAMQLFSENYGGRCYILRDGNSVEDRESLSYCNNPFKLPLNEFTYGEFKRRFSERWTNLSINLYDTSPQTGGLWKGSKELTYDFNMKSLKNADKAFLHDYLYISTWGEKLAFVRIAAEIKNDRLGIYAEGNLRNERLKDFQSM